MESKTTSPSAEGAPAYPAGWLTSKPYQPRKHLLKLTHRNRKTNEVVESDYLPVQQRILWFVTEQRQLMAAGLATMPYIIRPRLVECDPERGHATFECYVRDCLGNEATDYGSESVADWTDYREKASTKATGRALMLLGYGTQFDPQLDEGDRVVDSPIQRPTASTPAAPAAAAASRQPSAAPAHAPQAAGEEASAAEPPANEQQLASIRKLCAALGREEPATGVLTFDGAGALIRQLSREYNTSRGQRATPERTLTPAAAQTSH